MAGRRSESRIDRKYGRLAPIAEISGRRSEKEPRRKETLVAPDILLGFHGDRVSFLFFHTVFITIKL